MPALGDYVDTVGTRLIDLLKADAVLTGTAPALVRPGNWITFTGALGDPSPPKTSRMDEDLPEAELEVLSFGPATAAAPGRPPETFGNVGPAAPPTCPRLIFKQYVFRLTYTLPNQRSGLATQLETRTELVLLRSGAKLSLAGSPLAWVSGWGPLSGRFPRERAPGTGEILTRKVVIDIPVALALTLADVLG